MRIGTFLWLATYLFCLVAITVGLRAARQRALMVYGTASAQVEWEEWRERVRSGVPTQGTTRRKVPQSQQPPALVLMRDYFTACLVFCLVLSSALFFTTMLIVRGALRPTEICPNR